MAQSISVSDFKVRVRLDTKSTVKGLKRLERQLAMFAGKAQTSMKKGQKATDGLRRSVKKTNTAVRGLSGSLGGLVTSAFSVYALANAFNAVAKSSMKTERAIMTMNAAVAGSGIGQSLSAANDEEGLKKLQKNQRGFAQHLAKDFGMDLGSTTSDYAKFFAAASDGIGVKGSQDMFKSFAELSTVYGLDPEKQKRAMTAFTQMASKNQVMAEELKQQLGDVLPGSMAIFARAMTKMGTHGEVTVKKLQEMMETGEVIASEVLPFVAQEMADMARADDSLNKALRATPLLLQKLQTTLQIAGANMGRQFGDEMGALIQTLTRIFENSDLHIVFGTIVANILHHADTLAVKIEELTKEFSEWFNTLSTEEKRQFIANLTYALEALVALIVGSLLRALFMLGAGWIFAMGPIGWITAAVVGLGVALYKNKEAIAEWGRNFMETIDPILGPLEDILEVIAKLNRAMLLLPNILTGNRYGFGDDAFSKAGADLLALSSLGIKHSPLAYLYRMGAPTDSASTPVGESGVNRVNTSSMDKSVHNEIHISGVTTNDPQDFASKIMENMVWGN